MFTMFKSIQENGFSNWNEKEEEDPSSYESCDVAAQFILSQTKYRPQIGLICGSGLASIGEMVEYPDIIPYDMIPHFSKSTVKGHKSQLLIGSLYHVPVLIMQGRFHYYEGYSIKRCTMPVRVMKLCGIKLLISTNAAGGINDSLKMGDIMIIQDHINLLGMVGINPLRGVNDERFGPRFFATNNIYDLKWREIAKDVAKDLKIDDIVKEGVYSLTGGPNYESPAEINFLGRIGVDAIGMSTVHENIVAHHCGMKIFSFSLITNNCIVSIDTDRVASHEEVVQAAKVREHDLKVFVAHLIWRFHQQLE